MSLFYFILFVSNRTKTTMTTTRTREATEITMRSVGWGVATTQRRARLPGRRSRLKIFARSSIERSSSTNSAWRPTTLRVERTYQNGNEEIILTFFRTILIIFIHYIVFKILTPFCFVLPYYFLLYTSRLLDSKVLFPFL